MVPNFLSIYMLHAGVPLVAPTCSGPASCTSWLCSLPHYLWYPVCRASVCPPVIPSTHVGRWQLTSTPTMTSVQPCSFLGSPFFALLTACWQKAPTPVMSYYAHTSWRADSNGSPPAAGIGDGEGNMHFAQTRLKEVGCNIQAHELSSRETQIMGASLGQITGR